MARPLESIIVDTCETSVGESKLANTSPSMAMWFAGNNIQLRKLGFLTHHMSDDWYRFACVSTSGRCCQTARWFLASPSTDRH